MDFKLKLLDNAKDIRESFIDHFVMSWNEFRIKQENWITKMARTNCPIDREWYEKAYMWDRMNPAFPSVPMATALAFLREHNGLVFFMAETGKDIYYRGEKFVDFVAEADVHTLAARIEREWYDSYRLAMQNMYDADAFLPGDLYVFDSSMTWCVVFTHETTDWESELDDPMKTAESRVCIICKY